MSHSGAWTSVTKPVEEPISQSRIHFSTHLWIRYDRRQRFRLRSLHAMLALSPTQFEQAVGNLLHDLGYRDVRRVGGAPWDAVADLWCRDEQGQSVVVQCKRYAPNKPVGSPTMQSFIGMVTIHHKADCGIIVTTSRFTQPAVDLARTHKITLIDGERLGQLIERVRNQNNKQGNPYLAS